MTTIAYKDGVFAGDSLVTQNGNRFDYVSKIMVGGGYTVAYAGGLAICQRIADEIIRNGMWGLVDLKVRGKGSFEFLIWWKNGLYGLDEELYPYRLNKRKFYALGSGTDVAIGAMAQGAGAVEAVKIASKYDCHTGGKIKVVMVGTS